MDGFLNSASQNSAPPRNPVSKSFKQKKKNITTKIYVCCNLYSTLLRSVDLLPTCSMASDNLICHIVAVIIFGTVHEGQ